MGILEDKKCLRKEMFEKRGSIDKILKKEYDKYICDRLWTKIQELKFKKIHCYLPIGSEVDTRPLIEKMLDNNLTVISPKTLQYRKLEHLVLQSLEETEIGLFNTRHPRNSRIFTENYDLIIVPGLAFCNDNFRLGYGGGYYDNFLSENPTAYKIGICYPCQRIEKIPTEPHDAKLDEILHPMI